MLMKLHSTSIFLAPTWIATLKYKRIAFCGIFFSTTICQSSMYVLSSQICNDSAINTAFCFARTGLNFSPALLRNSFAILYETAPPEATRSLSNRNPSCSMLYYAVSYSSMASTISLITLNSFSMRAWPLHLHLIRNCDVLFGEMRAA